MNPEDEIEYLRAESDRRLVLLRHAARLVRESSGLPRTPEFLDFEEAIACEMQAEEKSPFTKTRRT